MRYIFVITRNSDEKQTVKITALNDAYAWQRLFSLLTHDASKNIEKIVLTTTEG